MTEVSRREFITAQLSGSASSTDIGATNSSDKPVLVSIFQRGAADALNSVVPYEDPDYVDHRPNIHIPDPGRGSGGALDLDGFFGLNPNLTNMHSLYQSGDLALVHACGIPHGSRSHFKAQALVEQASQDQAGLDGGWLGRHYQIAHTVSPPASAYCVVAISGSLPMALSGAPSPIALANIADFFVDERLLTSGYADVLQSLYAQDVPMNGAANVAISAFNELADAAPQLIGQSNGAVYPDSQLGGNLRQAAQLIKSDLPVESILLDSPGWDHHENIAYYLPRSLSDLDQSIAAFLLDLGTLAENVTVLVHSEFGRRVRENASLGVDHGAGGVVYVIGAKVNGGQVYGQWPTLGNDALDQGEDLGITTDLRSIYAEILGKRLGATDLGRILPGFAGPTDLGILA